MDDFQKIFDHTHSFHHILKSNILERIINGDNQIINHNTTTLTINIIARVIKGINKAIATTILSRNSDVNAQVTLLFEVTENFEIFIILLYIVINGPTIPHHLGMISHNVGQP